MRSIHEGARDLVRDIANTDAYVTSRRQRKKVEMLFAHLKGILKLDRLRLRGPAALETSFSSPPPPRTSANSPSSSRSTLRPLRPEPPATSAVTWRSSDQRPFSTASTHLRP
jgi:hypothetical protein